MDDDPLITAAVTRSLERRSIRVLPASDGMQGYWFALTRRPDAIVTDLRMPRWDGEALVDCLARNSVTRTIPIVVLSGYASDFRLTDNPCGAIDAVMEKPVDLRRLVRTLRRSWKRQRV